MLYTRDDGMRADEQPMGGVLDSMDSIPESLSEGGSSFLTAAATQPEAAAAVTCDHAGLHLSLARLQQFGGLEEVASHFRIALTQEARRNLLSILLDCMYVRLSKVIAEPAADLQRGVCHFVWCNILIWNLFLHYHAMFSLEGSYSISLVLLASWNMQFGDKAMLLCGGSARSKSCAAQGCSSELDDGTGLIGGPEHAASTCRLATAGSSAEALSGAFLCGLPGFAMPLGLYVSQQVLVFMPLWALFIRLGTMESSCQRGDEFIILITSSVCPVVHPVFFWQDY
jgi:hypothetical protein